ncbi:MAG: hypothetical protein MI919_25535, partial [Holophagales bacterium]|nr:hypothetical protein [Holophagales bacterium]
EARSLELVGKAAGSVVEHEESHGEGEGGHSHRFEITIDEVKEQELPELDDALAEKAGGFGSAEELRDVVLGDLRQRKTAESRDQRRGALLRQLRERHPLTLPEGVVQQEAENMVRTQAERLAQQGVDLEKAEVDWMGMLEQIRPMAEQSVHERLVLDAVAGHLEMRLDEERFERFLASAARSQGTSSLALRQRLSEDGRLESLRSDLLRSQTISHLLGDEPSPEGEQAAEDSDSAGGARDENDDENHGDAASSGSERSAG